MSVLLTLAIILAIIAIVCAVKSAPAAVAKAHTGATTPVVNVVNSDCMEAVVMVLAYAKASLKEERLLYRRARTSAWHIKNRASKEAAHINGEAKRMEITIRDQQRSAGRAAQKALVREAQAQGISVAKLLARKAQGMRNAPKTLHAKQQSPQKQPPPRW